MWDVETTRRVLIQAHQAGLLYPGSGEELLERAKVWAAALSREGVTEAEASAAVIELAVRRRGIERTIGISPGHVVEIVEELKRDATKARKLAAGECVEENCDLGWERFTDDEGYAKVRPCLKCRPMAVPA